MRYVIIGAGAVGASLAAEFHRAGVRYLLVARGAQFEHLREHGLTYARPAGTETLPLNVAAEAAVRLQPDDVLLLTVKTQDVSAAVNHWADEAVTGGGVGADLPIVTLQNGLEAERVVARRFAHVYAASILVPAVFVKTGTVTVPSAPQLASVVIGRFPAGRDTLSARITADLTLANSLAEEREDIVRWKTAKLLHNVRNALELFSGDQARIAFAADEVAKEAKAILQAAGQDPARPEERRVDISGWKLVRELFDTPMGQSTWQSFTRGARSEVDYLNGEIVLLGLLAGRDTPWNSAVQRLAAELSTNGGKPGDISVERLIALAEQPKTHTDLCA